MDFNTITMSSPKLFISQSIPMKHHPQHAFGISPHTVSVVEPLLALFINQKPQSLEDDGISACYYWNMGSGWHSTSASFNGHHCSCLGRL